MIFTALFRLYFLFILCIVVIFLLTLVPVPVWRMGFVTVNESQGGHTTHSLSNYFQGFVGSNAYLQLYFL